MIMQIPVITLRFRCISLASSSRADSNSPFAVKTVFLAVAPALLPPPPTPVLDAMEEPADGGDVSVVVSGCEGITMRRPAEVAEVAAGGEHSDAVVDEADADVANANFLCSGSPEELLATWWTRLGTLISGLCGTDEEPSMTPSMNCSDGEVEACETGVRP